MIDGTGDSTEPEWVLIEDPAVPNAARQAVIAVIGVVAIIALAVAAILAA